MMKHSFQETKNSNFLYYGIILVSVLLEVIMVWQLEKLIPLLYPGFIGFLVFHVLYHLILFLVAKRSGRWDYLMIWGLFLMFNLLYDSFLGLLFLGLSFGMWCDFRKIPAISPVLASLLARLFFYTKLVTHFILFENQIQTTSTSPCRTQVQPAASFLVCSLIFIEYQ